MRILLTNGNRNAGLWMTRHLGAAGHEVIVTDCRPLAFGLKSRHAAAFERTPAPDDPQYADCLLALIRRLRPDVLLPQRDLAAISARRDEFERETGVLVADSDAYRSLADKATVYSLCRELEIPHPRVLATDPETLILEMNDPGDGTPMAVIKPRQDFGAGQGIAFVRRREGLADLWQILATRHGALVATEFVPGAVNAQNALHLLFDRNSELIEFFVLRKERQWPERSGITVEATSTHELNLVAQMLPLFRKLRWRGPAEVELKRDSRSGHACVIEINPRFSGTLPFALSAGVDLPGAMMRASVGQCASRALQPYYEANLNYWNPWPYTRSVVSDLCHPGRMRQGLRGLAMPLLRHPFGNPHDFRDPKALLGKLFLPVAEALRQRTNSP